MQGDWIEGILEYGGGEGHFWGLRYFQTGSVASGLAGSEGWGIRRGSKGSRAIVSVRILDGAHISLSGKGKS
jgi:hypothetical protein